MNQALTAAAIDIYKTSTHVSVPIDTISWINSYTVKITLADTMEYATGYTLEVAETAESTDGRGLDGNSDGLPGGDFQDTFTVTSMPPYVVSVDPFDGETNVAINADLTIEFSNDMNMVSVRDNLYVNGSLSTTIGSFSSPDAKTIVLDFFSNLTYSTVYEVKVQDSAMDTLSIYLDGDHDGVAGTDFISHFTVQNPQKPYVVDTDPENGQEDVEPTDPVVVRFSETIDTSSVIFGSTLTISPAVTGYSPTWSNSNKRLSFTADFEHSKEYTVTLTTGVTDSQGEAMEANYVFSFTCLPSPVAISIDLPSNWPPYRDIEGTLTIGAGSATAHAIKRAAIAIYNRITDSWDTLGDSETNYYTV